MRTGRARDQTANLLISGQPALPLEPFRKGKHKVFKKIIHDTHNYKNVLKTLAERHQNMMAFYLSPPRFLKPPVQISKVESVFVESLPIDTHSLISSNIDSISVYGTEQVIIEGTTFVVGVFVCTGAHAVLPEFKEIRNILLIGNDIFFLLKDYETWYVEHLRPYEQIIQTRAIQ